MIILLALLILLATFALIVVLDRGVPGTIRLAVLHGQRTADRVFYRALRFAAQLESRRAQKDAETRNALAEVGL